MPKIILAAHAALYVLATFPANTARASDIADQVDALFAQISPTDDPGCAVGIARGDSVIYRRGFGAANVAFEAPNTTSTAFEIASGSKTFTSACIALLMDQGKLNPQDDVRSILPELKLNQPVRIRHLLRCESGVWAQFHIMPLAGWDNVPVQSPYSKEDYFTVLCGQKHLPFQPGSEFQYSSGDIFLLGMVVERITGQTLAEYARKNLFEPLGMSRTWFLEDPAIIIKNRAVGHWKSDVTWTSGRFSPETKWRHWNTTAFLGGGGSVVSTVDDMLKWATVYREDRLPTGKYVGELTRDGTVLENRFILDVDAYMKHVNPHPDNSPMGVYRGLKRIQITGGYWGFTCCLSHFPEHNVTIVCLSNSDAVSAFGNAVKIADIVLADHLGPKPEPLTSEPFVEIAQNQIKRFAGSYRQKGNMPLMRVTERPGSLIVFHGFGGQAVLRPVSTTRFRVDGESPFRPSAVFEFSTSNGAVAGMTLSSSENGIHERLPFDRVEEAGEYDERALRQFSGSFVSPELGAVYRIRVHDGSLQLRVGSRRWEPMQALEPDEFSPVVEDVHNTRYLRFTRSDDGNIDGFSIGFWRIHGVRFDRAEIP